MTSTPESGAGAAVTGLFLGSLAIAGAVALVTAPLTPRLAVARDGGAGTRPATADGPLVSTASVSRTGAPGFPIRH